MPNSTSSLYTERLGPRRASSALTWNPGQLGSSLGLWLEADYGITLNSGNVSNWADRSGNGNHAVQGTTIAQPTYVAGTASSVAAVRTIATTFMTIPDQAKLKLGSGCTIYQCFKSSSTNVTIGGGVCGKWSDTLGLQDWTVQANTYLNANVSNSAVSEITTNTVRSSNLAIKTTIGSPVVIGMRWDGSASTMFARGTEGTPVAVAGAKTATTAPVSIGRYGSDNVAGYIDGDVYAILIFNTYFAAGSAKDLQIKAYLKRKWGAV